MSNKKNIYTEEQKRDNEILQKEINWIKSSMDTDKHGHTGAYNTLLQNIASMLILFLGILGAVNLLVIHYLTFLDALHFILINFCLILIFIMIIKHYELKEKNKHGGIKNMEKEFLKKKCLVRKRYEKMKFGDKQDNSKEILKVDIDNIQKEFNKCPF